MLFCGHRAGHQGAPEGTERKHAAPPTPTSGFTEGGPSRRLPAAPVPTEAAASVSEGPAVVLRSVDLGGSGRRGLDPWLPQTPRGEGGRGHLSSDTGRGLGLLAAGSLRLHEGRPSAQLPACTGPPGRGWAPRVGFRPRQGLGSWAPLTIILSLLLLKQPVEDLSAYALRALYSTWR